MTVTFYRFAKKQNSTKRPLITDVTATIQCVLKAPCSQLQPVLELRLEDMTVAPTFNYAYIAEFSRYYYITDITYAGATWIVSMSVDALATYKTEIGSTSCYIARSSHTFDGSINDSLYPMKSSYTVQKASVQMYASNTAGYYVIGLVGKPFSNAEPTGGITYVVLNVAAFNEFRNALFDDDLAYVLSGNTSKDVGIVQFGVSLLKLIFDPFEYIRSVCWMPSKPPVKTGTYYTIRMGYWQFSIANGVQLYDPTVAPAFPTKAVAIPKRTDTARGTYVHYSPYTEYKLYIPTVGYVSLETSKLAAASYLYFDLRMDPIAQTSYIKVYTYYGVDAYLLGVFDAGLVVPVQLAQSGVTYGGMAMGALSGMMDVAGAVGAHDAGGIFNAYTGVMGPGGIWSPSIQTISTTGGFAWLTDNDIIVYAWFFDLTDDDNSHFGRPLMKDGTPLTYPGYLLCQDCHVAIATAEPAEIDMITQAMTSGFFYE